MASKRSRTALTSGGLEPVLDGGGSGHSIFAKTFLAVLRENGGVIEGQSVFEQLRRPVLVNAPQEPKYSDIRFTRHEEGDFLFVRTGYSTKTASNIPDPMEAERQRLAKERAQFEAERAAYRQRTEARAKLDAERQALAEERTRFKEKQRKEEAMIVAKAPAFSAPQRMVKKLTGQDGAPMVLIPEGEFMMGSPEGEGSSDEHPRHRVHLDAFYMDQYEVTTSRYGAFMRASGRVAPEYWKYAKQVGNREKPVIGVDWHDANAYCEHYGKRLPTEAEWEKAARGTDERIYPWGNEPPTRRHANFDQCCDFRDYKVLTTVGSRAGGKSPYGVYDMAGNVWEWTADWYEEFYYDRSPARNPTGPSSGEMKVRRGGSWFNLPFYFRSAYRLENTPTTRFVNVGFRCAQDAP
jgi:formylglycine-generating enzyme required for sulfatase activity